MSKTLPQSEYDAKLEKAGIGHKIIGSGNDLVDRFYTLRSIEDIRAANKFAKEKLSWFEYESERADCDTYHLLHYARMLEWFLKNKK